MEQQQRISRRDAVRAGGAALMAGALGAQLVPGGTQARQAPPSPVGVWVVSSTRAGQIPNGVLLTIHPDGTLLRIGTNHPTEAPGVGVWEQVSERLYNFSYVSLQFDATGAFAGRRKASLQITFDPSGDSLAGSGTVAFSDANDVPGDAVEADITATRMVVERPA